MVGPKTAAKSIPSRAEGCWLSQKRFCSRIQVPLQVWRPSQESLGRVSDSEVNLVFGTENGCSRGPFGQVLCAVETREVRSRYAPLRRSFLGRWWSLAPRVQKTLPFTATFLDWPDSCHGNLPPSLRPQEPWPRTHGTLRRQVCCHQGSSEHGVRQPRPPSSDSCLHHSGPVLLCPSPT